jgi:hypothetical protein
MNPGHHSRRPRTDPQDLPTAEEIRATQVKIDAQAKEVLGHMYQAVLTTPAFTLQDGTRCQVDSFYEPEVNSGGDLKCGFDVLLGDGTQLEFTVANTGWGRSLAPGLAEKPRRTGRGR